MKKQIFCCKHARFINPNTQSNHSNSLMISKILEFWYSKFFQHFQKKLEIIEIIKYTKKGFYKQFCLRNFITFTKINLTCGTSLKLVMASSCPSLKLGNEYVRFYDFWNSKKQDFEDDWKVLRKLLTVPWVSKYSPIPVISRSFLVIIQKN